MGGCNGVGSAFSVLTELIERLEATDRKVLGVATEDVTDEDGPLVVDLSVRTSLFNDVTVDDVDLVARSVSANEDGTVTVDLDVSIPRSARTEPVEPTNHDGVGRDDTPKSTETAARDRSGSVPVHRDPDRLREVYAACDTFAEMTEALGAEVTPVTVRRNMIKQGIHQPRSNGSTTEPEPDDNDILETERGGADASSEEDVDLDVESDPDPTPADAPSDTTDTTEAPSSRSDRIDTDTDPEAIDGDVGDDTTASTDIDGGSDLKDEGSDTGTDVGSTANDTVSADAGSNPKQKGQITIPDGIGLPNDIELDQFKEVVSASNTLYEAQVRLSLDRERTRKLLEDFGVLDLVHGRVATRHERRASPGEIDQRIREHLSGSA